MIHAPLPLCFLALFGFVTLCGCGESGPEIVAVQGKITYGGGNWPKPGAVYLLPVEAAEGEPQIPGFANFDVDGSFTAECNSGAGLVPGKYRVTVECWELAPDESRAESPLGKSYVPAKYRDPSTSDLEFEIKPGDSSREVNFDVPRQ